MFLQVFMNTCRGLDIVLGAEDSVVRKTDKNLCSRAGKGDRQQGI